MRMIERICEDQKKIHTLLLEQQTGYLGLSSRDMPYIVPLNYVWYDGNIYFHGANEGRKVDIMRENANATFVVCESMGTLVNPIPANTDTAYLSVMVFGKMEIVTDLVEATSIMQQLLDKYVPGYYETPLSRNHVEKYQSSLGSKTGVYKLVTSEMTAKENILVESMEYYAGRSVDMDVKKKIVRMPFDLKK